MTTDKPLNSTVYPSPVVLWCWVAVIASVAAVILAFTPFTNNLDDIKVTLLHALGGGLLALFCWMWLRNSLSLPHRWVMIPVAAWFVSFIGTVVLHSLHLVPNYNPYQWIGWILIGQYLALLGIFLVQAGVLRTYRMLEMTLMFWVAVVFVECALGLIHYSGFLKVVYRFLYGDGPATTPMAGLLLTFIKSPDMLGTVLNRQFFGDLLALWAPLCLAGAVIWTDLKRRLFALTSLALSVPCTYLTFSKAVLPFYAGGLILTVVGIVVHTHYRKIRIPHLPWVAAGLAIILATLVFFTFDQVSDRFKGVGFSLNSRVIIWDGGMKIFKEHPILGAGPGSFRVLFPQFRSPDYHLSQISNVTLWAHNRVVDLLLEQGAVGFTLYFWMLGALFWQAYRVIRHGKDERVKVIAIALVSGITAYFGTALFHPGIRWVIGATPYWAVLGMLAGLGQVETWQEQEELGTRRRLQIVDGRQRALRTAALVAALVVWVNPLPMSRPMYYSNLGYGIRYFAGAKENNTGLIMIASDRPDAAVECFKRSVEWNPTFITAYYKMAHAANSVMDEQGALDAYLALARYAPDYSEIHYNLGVIYRSFAENSYDQAEATSDTQKKAAALADALKSIADSRKEFARAAQMSNKISVQFAYAGALEREAEMQTDAEAAKELRRQAAEVYFRIPKLPFTVATQEENQLENEERMQKLAGMQAPRLFESAGEYEKAGDAYRVLFRAEPGNSRYLQKTIEMYKKGNRPDMAKLVLTLAIERSALNFEARDLLATLLVELGQPDTLKEAYLHSKILAKLDTDYPGQIPETIRTSNNQRLSTLQGRVEGL